ncbi:MAG TPA: tRNA (adenosine(37)-N6)-threonylcarbamoyltransferase complex dimerization subunit type 1 TsaB [Longimicrobiales bacterium]|nr:tRNA (adenosine(37)-N6)-threonylcarbamoyltransferase complex dimerization subunit type 1 TsaB [Longimicrobiales bacterium]
MSSPATFSNEAHYVALDTSGVSGSVAVGRGPDVVAGVTIPGRFEQAGRLVPAIDEALRAAGVDRRELAGVVVGEGPGSFTGVRIAAATAKGLAHALAVPMWGISSLLATALAYELPAIRYVLFDARSDRVYGACFEVGSTAVRELVPTHAGTLRETLTSRVPTGALFVGDAAARHRAVIEGAGFLVELAPAGRSPAEGLLRYLGLHPDTAPVADPASWEPRYVRASNVERPWSA